MSDTSRFELPLLQASQAQKHVTVNDALTRIDGLLQLTLQSVTLNAPPLTLQEGEAYGVGEAAVNEWAGQEGMVALYINGGWAFVPTTLGMRAYVADQNGWAGHDGAGWVLGMQTLSAHGAGMISKVIEVDHVLSAGPTSNAAYAIPGQSVVYGVTGRVLADITGSGLTGFSLGVSGSTNRYGSGLSPTQGSWLRGLTGAPLTYYSSEDLILTAEGGDFTAGTLRLAIHCLQFTLPSE
ncbi:MAG: DUF2793 domain-containing protein [Alphaproteobacteria bacterium]|nr:DUF2793 domain-containing protein [Alphaproteobacteria bacterium]MBU1281756.1 DUF2793 domain-containing protein [Alphaproteobacteria bacterium]MBU1573840.1 DUF2793 domain-containing protein [Alphaproteobacteria bacterium]MBU1830622.1 DUF2793 domain-containing protein [Alphaproteobacteria bacterium]MBU2079742.1 DUF2793 domain-containing protein [Alphaproteobacteria bacterium]